MPADRGLYMPERIPRLDDGFFASLGEKRLAEIGVVVGREYFAPDVPEGVLEEMLGEALDFPVPLVEIGDGVFVLELFHGPTLAFKDVGARVMARLMGYFAGGGDRELTVLVATSGDTGSAVAQAFYGIPGIRVAVLYPSGKITRLQEQQIATLDGNITPLEVDGTFDDCQRLVKEAFLDGELRRRCVLTSANSINIARWIPQSFYYFYALGQLAGAGRPVLVSVPSGNLGNVTAGLLARAMGLAVDRFVVAANGNRTVVDYLESGDYKPRPSVKTLSNAMDVGDPSNIARLMDLYDGKIERIRDHVAGFAFDDDETVAAIDEVRRRFGYVMDPHGAVGYLGLKEWMRREPGMHGIFLETAHPAKFGGDVEMPERLRACLGKEKRSIGMTADFEAFKGFLLEWSGDSW
jgi:threonine synthase